MAVALLLAACSGPDVAEQIIEQQSGIDDVSIDQNGGSVAITIQGEDGDVSGVIGGGSLPDDFPLDVPDGATVNATFESSDGYTASLSYPAGEYDSVVGFFQDYVDSGAVSEVNTFTSSSPAAVTWSFMRDGKGFSISVVDNTTEIVVTIIAES